MKARPIIMDAESVRGILGGRKTQTRRPILRGNLRCPYGQPGDLLWVRETFRVKIVESYSRKGPVWQRFVLYRADRDLPSSRFDRWRSPITMPRWASRITLCVVNVRLEGLQEITEADAVAEGCPDGVNPREWFRQRWDTLNARRGFSWDVNPWVWVIEFENAGGSQTKPRLKRLKLNGIPTKRTCPDCGRTYMYFRWSPFWCPECDEKRVERVTRHLDGRRNPK